MSNETRVSDARLAALIELTIGRDTKRALLELQANRRGEFICSRCHLRSDPINTDTAYADF